MKALGDYEVNQSKNQIAVFDAQTDRMTAQINAQKAGADINYTNIKAFGQQLDNKGKAQDQFMKRLTPLTRTIQPEAF